jgi:hypothetical protein
MGKPIQMEEIEPPRRQGGQAGVMKRGGRGGREFYFSHKKHKKHKNGFV